MVKTKAKNQTRKKIEKQVKKANPFVLLLFALVFVGCGIGGYFLSTNMIKNDKFEIIGEKTINLTLGETYQDEGAVAISFGKDITDKILSENNIDFTKPGQYYIKYTVEDARYKDVCRYRTVVISEVGNE